MQLEHHRNQVSQLNPGRVQNKLCKSRLCFLTVAFLGRNVSALARNQEENVKIHLKWKRLLQLRWVHPPLSVTLNRDQTFRIVYPDVSRGSERFTRKSFQVA